MTPEEAVAMELLTLAYHISQSSKRSFPKRLLCDVLLCRAIYVTTGDKPLYELDRESLRILKESKPAADEWVKILTDNEDA